MTIIDLSVLIKPGMNVYEGDPEVCIDEIHTLESHGWRLSQWSFGSHTGSHVDAPYHMVAQGKTLSDYPLERFISEAVVVNVNDEIFPEQTALLFREGELSDAIVSRIVKAKPPFIVIGNEASLPISVEKAMLEQDILTFTDLVNMEKLPSDRSFMFYGMPLNIEKGNGSPVRAFAVIE